MSNVLKIIFCIAIIIALFPFRNTASEVAKCIEDYGTLVDIGYLK